jgi:hypothetical protein
MRPGYAPRVAAIVARAALEDLRRKYAEMLEMRLSHEAGDEEPSTVRVRMARLASRFPGALRELDDLELNEIRRCVAQLDAVLQGTLEVEPWMQAVAMFHALARGALCAKRWLAGRKPVDLQLRLAFAEALPTLRFPEEARAWVQDLERVASPPFGRVTDLVLSRVALELGTTDWHARTLVFGLPRRARARR